MICILASNSDISFSHVDVLYPPPPISSHSAKMFFKVKSEDREEDSGSVQLLSSTKTNWKESLDVLPSPLEMHKYRIKNW